MSRILLLGNCVTAEHVVYCVIQNLCGGFPAGKTGRLMCGGSRFSPTDGASAAAETRCDPDAVDWRRARPNCATAYPPARVKFTLIVVSTSTGSPFRKYGLYFHCFTASIAAGASMGCPLTRCRFSMEPSLLITACRTTVP